MSSNPFGKPENFRNRELSWLEFDERVLSEARDKSLPLFERLKFYSITSSNLDEFYMIRVASLKDMVHAGYKKKDIAGMTAQQQLDAISKRTHELVNRQYASYNRSVLPALRQNHLIIIDQHQDLTPAQAAFVDDYFMREIYPVLTPMAVDSSRPFPLIANKTLNIGALIQSEENEKEVDFATVQVPGMLPRYVTIPSESKKDTTVILLEQIIEKNLQKLFLNRKIICAHPYRIMRNADIPIDEDEAADLLKEIQPHEIFVAGDLADPHGTHRKCTDAVFAAIDLEKQAGAEWLKSCRIWMYRGAWAEWEIENIEMCVPMSPEELRAKRNAILKHSSQMEGAPFLGNDERLFWQRAEDRNRGTAKLYDDLGLASYEAMEAFVQYHP